VTIEGTLDEFHLPDILQMVAQQQKTGILTVQGESTIVAVSFLGGRVVAADSLQETVEERLGEVLVRRGLLTRQAFHGIVERQRRGQGRLVDLLVEDGLLDRAQVLDSLRQQTTDLLEQLLAWDNGEFKFYANDEVAYEEGFQPLAVEELLISMLPPEGPEGPERSLDGPAAAAVPAEPAAFGAPAAATEGPPPGAGAFGQAAAAEPAGQAVPWTGVAWHDEAAVHEPAAPVFVPPEAAARPAAAPRTAAAPRLWLPTALATLASLALLAALFAAPARFLLPMPWQASEREAYRDVQRQAAYLSIDGAAKTYFLIEGRFPDDLERLVALSLLDAEDLADPAGAPLRFIAREDRYELRPAGAAGAELASVEAITGNFLLDPDYLTATEIDKVPPLVLLD
jgi:hypothetical protein